MNNLNPKVLIMGWTFAKKVFLPWSVSQLDTSKYLTDKNKVIIKTRDGFYLIPAKKEE